MVKRVGCLPGQYKINNKCYDINTGRGNLSDLAHATNCYEELARLEDLFNSGKPKNDLVLEQQIRSVIVSCLKDRNTTPHNEVTLHFKKLDAVAKHAKISKNKGVRPGNDRGDFIKIANGHGKLTMFPSS